MSRDEDKIKHSKRLHDDENHIKKQVKIARAHGLTKNDPILAEPHRLAKHHAMDCGNPECYVCGNPRKTHKDKLTIQEKRNNQQVDDDNPND